jgi:RNA-directed DNA polymerase
MSRAQDLGSISTRLRRIAKLAREAADRCFVSLGHNIDYYFLQEAYARTRKNGAPGVDNQTAADYAVNLRENLRSLLDRFKSGRYKAPAVRRAHLPKGDGNTRPIGIPTFEDKILQWAVKMVLEPIYEQDFKDFSYGFRPGRSPHGALRDLRDKVKSMGGGWVLKVDIQNFFEELVHRHLHEFLDRRVRDGVLRRAIGKWLKAGVMEEKVLYHRTQGTPQGGVISPLLANIYLHEVVDRWFVEVVCPHLVGQGLIFRFADDVVMAFEWKHDALRVRKALAKRLERFGLRLHPEKTRLVRFQRPARSQRPGSDQRPGSFSWLGFTHYWGKSRHGNWVIMKKTDRKRLSRALREIGQWCKRHRHRRVRWQRARLAEKLRGHYAYYGVTGNSRSLGRFRHWVERIWRKWLNRRSQKKRMPWKRFKALLRYHELPMERIVHQYAAA